MPLLNKPQYVTVVIRPYNLLHFNQDNISDLEKKWAKAKLAFDEFYKTSDDYMNPTDSEKIHEFYCIENLGTPLDPLNNEDTRKFFFAEIFMLCAALANKRKYDDVIINIYFQGMSSNTGLRAGRVKMMNLDFITLLARLFSENREVHFFFEGHNVASFLEHCKAGIKNSTIKTDLEYFQRMYFRSGFPKHSQKMEKLLSKIVALPLRAYNSIMLHGDKARVDENGQIKVYPRMLKWCSSENDAVIRQRYDYNISLAGLRPKKGNLDIIMTLPKEEINLNGIN